MPTEGRIVSLAVVASILLAGCSGGSGTTSSFKVIRGSGVIADESRGVTGFAQVTFASEGSLTIEQGALEALRVRADDNLLPYLVTAAQNGALEIRTRAGFDLQPTRPIEFFLTVASLDRLVFSGVGSVEMSRLATDELSLESSGVGAVRLSDLDARRLDLVASGIGNVSISGQVEEQSVEIRGLGDCDSGDLVSREATVTLGSIGSATVRVSDLLVATIRSSGSVYYFGDPIVRHTITGSGRVVRLGAAGGGR